MMMKLNLPDKVQKNYQNIKYNKIHSILIKTSYKVEKRVGDKYKSVISFLQEISVNPTKLVIK